MIVGFFDSCSKVGSGLFFIFALLAFVFPRTIWRPIEAIVASRNGLTGFVYYEVGYNRSLTCVKGKTFKTCDGQLFLLDDTKNAEYEEIKKGHRLIVNTRNDAKVNFRIGPSKKSAPMYVLKNGECVIVIEKPSHPIDVKDAVSGGWLEVATTSCGLFK